MLTSDARGRITWESLPPRLTEFYLNTQHRTEASMPYTRWWSPQNAFNATPPPDYDKDPPRGRDGFWGLHFDLVPGEQTIPVTVERGIHLSGKIILPEDFPANRHVSATIVPVRPDPASFSGDSREDISVDRETGTFSVWMPAGNGLRYRVLAFYQNPLNVKERLYLPAALSEPFDSKPGDTFTFELSMLGGGWVTGRVMNTEGQPQAGLRIAGIPTDHAGGLNEELEAVTDADGRFTMGPIRATEYGFIPEARRYGRKADYYKHQKLGVVVEGETTDLGDIVFDDEVL